MMNEQFAAMYTPCSWYLPSRRLPYTWNMYQDYLLCLSIAANLAVASLSLSDGRIASYLCSSVSLQLRCFVCCRLRSLTSMHFRPPPALLPPPPSPPPGSSCWTRYQSCPPRCAGQLRRLREPPFICDSLCCNLLLPIPESVGSCAGRRASHCAPAGD